MPELEEEIKEQVCARKKRGSGALIRPNDVREGLQKGQAEYRAFKRLRKLLYLFMTTLLSKHGSCSNAGQIEKTWTFGSAVGTP